jgi:hypothetical protein
VRCRREGQAAVLTIDHPPVNASNVDVRRSLYDALDRALSEPGVEVVVITGEGTCQCCSSATPAETTIWQAHCRAPVSRCSLRLAPRPGRRRPTS